MLVLRLLLLVLFTVAAYAPAHAQVSFDRDSISVTYIRCAGGSGTTPVVLRNLSQDSVEVDLRMIDSNRSRSWYLEVDGIETTRLLDRMIPPGDSIAMLLHQGSGSGVSIDTLVVSSEASSDTIFISANVLRPELTYPSGRTDFGVILAGETKSRVITLTNVSDVPFPVTSITLTNPAWTVSNLASTDTIRPGERREVTITFDEQPFSGTHTGFLYVSGGCGQMAFGLDAKVVLRGLYWSAASITDTIKGCPRPSRYVMEIRNAGTMNITIDSIGFTKGYGYQWSIPSSPQGIAISPDGSVQFDVDREVLGGFTFLVLYPSIGKPDTLPVRITFATARPELKNTTDTVIFNRTTDQPIVYAATLENEGEVSYRLTSMTYTGSGLWMVEMPDTTTELAKNRTTEITARFAGAVAPGEYAMTYTVRGTPCDSAITQTLIARVTMADVTEADEAVKVQIFPTRATTMVHLRVAGEARYSIVDVLGNEALSGVTVGPENGIDVSSLAQGSYFVRVMSDGEITTIPFVIAR